MYLLDTNIWLENILEQERHEEVKQFLNYIEERLLYISEFSFYSIALHLCYKNREDDFMKFVNDLFIEGSVNLVILIPDDMKDVINNSKKFKLNFDDAYQYTSSNKNNLTLVSFDTDFDKTDLERRTPMEIISK